METMKDRLRVMLGDERLSRLEDARVLVFGCGGVGSSCIEALARGGIGTLVIVDKDVVAPSNINRQAIAFESTVGKRKVDVMAAMIADINPSCRVFAHDAFVLAENLVELYEACLDETDGHIDYVVDAIDTVSTKLALAALAQERGFELISSMGGAKKIHPECLRIADVHKTVNCSLARIMRKECRKRGIRHLRVLYSCEEPVRIAAAPGAARSERTDLGTASFMLYSCEQPVPVPVREGAERRERSNLGTASFVPPIMGQMIAGEVLRHISGLGEGDDVSAALAMHDAAQKGQLAGKRGGRA